MTTKPSFHPYVVINPGPVNDPMNGDNPEADTLARRSLDPKINKITGEKERKGILASIREVAESQYLSESKMSVNKFKDVLEHFVNFVVEKIELKSSPKIVLKCTEDFSQQAITFGTFNTQTEETTVSITNRHPMDVLRSVAHELVHHKQLEDGRLEEGSGDTGSDIENEANATAGVIMREYGKEYPEMFGSSAITKLDEEIRKIFDGKTGPRKLFDKESKAEHDKNAKNKNYTATTGGNTSEYTDDPVDEDVKVIQIVNHKGNKYKKEFHEPGEYDNWLEKARKKPGRKFVKLAEDFALVEKSDKSGIPYELLYEVFVRGIHDWIESDITTHTPDQWAFNRVNSFIANGEARKLDEDLIVERGLIKKLLGDKKSSAEKEYKKEWLDKEKKKELAKKWRKERAEKAAKTAADEKKVEVHKHAYKRWSQAARASVDKHISINGQNIDRKQFYKDNANYHAGELNKRGIKAKKLNETKLPPNHHKAEALKAALKMIDDHFGPGGKYSPKTERPKLLKHREKDAGFNKWLKDKGKKNPYVKESVVTRPVKPKNELKIYKNDPRDKKDNSQIEQVKKQLVRAKVEKIRNQIKDIKKG